MSRLILFILLLPACTERNTRPVAGLDVPNECDFKSQCAEECKAVVYWGEQIDHHPGDFYATPEYMGQMISMLRDAHAKYEACEKGR